VCVKDSFSSYSPAKYSVQWPNNTYRNWWVGQEGPTAWPPRSPDMNSVDLYVWGHLKPLVYSLCDWGWAICNSLMVVAGTFVSWCITQNCRALCKYSSCTSYTSNATATQRSRYYWFMHNIYIIVSGSEIWCLSFLGFWWSTSYFVGLKVLTAVSTKMAVLWVVAPCSLVEVYQRFRGSCCLHHQGDLL
jgi:hypothetical protein